MAFITPPSFGFGKSSKDKVQERVIYQATNEGRRQVEDYLVDGNTGHILGVIVERDTCTIADIEAKTHIPRKSIIGEIENMRSLGWVTKKGGQGSGGMGFPQGYPPFRR